ncbi:DUF1801 domain-containing protein [Acidaminobacter hydrogenoformans]|uniref:YdhG-like domain-containing protein n=1 Tax=Acidaminobacter hydrogenoformans DSM 2784 TaxID=1120920 RepID=A0A1G5S3H6_9FIRM|nr:DUF1801 domain-containing protein [Acidaminobacter hydrogenoformans]SCZ80109.1 protein of unknown function (DU1801) [Acidaminobacter hydrogenoformans DSM 2784]
MHTELNVEKPATPQAYLDSLPAERKAVLEKLRSVILENLPDGFEETISYGMLGYVVPHKLYPAGYHVNPKEPLPFISLASQKNYIALYHMGIYAFPELQAWFAAEYAARVKSKLDMGKSCIRFKKMDDIPYELVAELCRKITVEDYISKYEDHEVSKSK